MAMLYSISKYMNCNNSLENRNACVKSFERIGCSRYSLGRPRSSSVQGKVNGFTLIEVMVVVAVIAILSAIALPSYNDYVTRGRIPDGIAPLADMQVRLEQYYQDNRTYVGACAAGTIAPLPANSRYFAFTCPTLAADNYVVVSKGLTDGPMGAFEYRLTLAAGGALTRTTASLPAGWTNPSPSTCWVLKRDGSC